MTTAAAYLIVDGHSLIHGEPSWRRIHDRTPRKARELVVAALQRYQDASGERVVVVFDGQGSTSVEPRRPHGIQVIHAGSDETADAVIERLVSRYADRYRISVATDDRAEQTTVSAFGAESVFSIRLLLERLAGAERAAGTELARVRREASRGFGVRGDVADLGTGG